MSNWATHALIGGVAGLALVQLAPAVVTPELVKVVGGQRVVGELAVVGLSGILATWPDIDEPNSWLSRHVEAGLTVLGFLLGCWAGLSGPYPSLPLAGVQLFVVCAVGGGLVGAFIGFAIPRGARTAAGGHRRGTHSLLLAGTMGLGALGLHWADQNTPALTLLALVWGLVWHLPGDLVTPAGVPLLYPISDRDVRLLPRPLAPFGEAIVRMLAFVAIWLLVRS